MSKKDIIVSAKQEALLVSAPINGLSPMQQMMQAAEAGIDVSQLGQMMELQERWEANQAKKAYVLAMSKFRSEAIVIEKTKRVNYASNKGGNVDYKHADLADVSRAVTPYLSQHGLSFSWSTGQSQSGISVTCTITHEQGHSESVTLTAGADASGGKNSIQAIGSTVTYLQRYTLLAICGLAAGDADDDGQGAVDSGAYASYLAAIDAIDTPSKLEEARLKTIAKYGTASKVPSVISNKFAERMMELGNAN